MKNFNINIDIEINGTTYISNDGSSGVLYHPKDREDLKKAVCDYIDSMQELEDWDLVRVEGRALASLVEEILRKQGADKLSVDADYRDVIEPAKAAELLQNGEDPMSAVTDFVMEMYEETYEAHVCEAERAIRDELQKRGLCADPDEVQDIVRSSVTTDYPLSYFMEQTYHTLVLVDTDDGNYDFTCNTAIKVPETKHWEKASLVWLAGQQGHDVKEMKKHFTGQKPSHSKLIKSMYEEVWEAPSDIQVLTFLTEMSLADLIRIAETDRKKGHITLGSSTMCGLYDPVSGGGSLLGIELEKDVKIPLECVWSCLPDVPTDKVHYSVEDTYGLMGSAYTRSRAKVCVD